MKNRILVAAIMCGCVMLGFAGDRFIFAERFVATTGDDRVMASMMVDGSGGGRLVINDRDGKPVLLVEGGKVTCQALDELNARIDNVNADLADARARLTRVEHAPAPAGGSSDGPAVVPEYKIIDDDQRFAPRKRVVDVLLQAPITEAELRALAKEIHRPGFDRTFMCYWLPHYVRGAGAWATTHFTPEYGWPGVKIEALQDPPYPKPEGQPIGPSP